MQRCLILLVVLPLLGVEPMPARAEGFPYASKTNREVALWTTGGISLGAGLFVSSELEPFAPEDIAALDPGDVNGFDRPAIHQWSVGAAHASDVLVGALLVAPVALMVRGEGSREPWTLAGMYGESLLLSGGLAHLIKAAVARTRPFVYNDDPDVPLDKKLEKNARLSFPSGHTTNAFLAATFLSSVYGTLYPDSSAKPWVWAASLTSASVTGYLRYRAGRHYPTDTLAGAALGSAVGILVPRLHRSDNLRIGADGDGTGAQLVWGFGF